MTILITGASKGIGAELARQLSKRHHTLLLVSRSEKLLNKLCEDCNAMAGRRAAHPFIYDLNELLHDPASFAARLNRVTDSIDVLVNNAGIVLRKKFEEITYEESLQVFKTNYFVPEILIRTVLPLLRKSESASVINVSSMGAVQGSSKFPGLSAYSSSKGALTSLTECLAEEFKPLNIRVNALAIGSVQTEMFENAFPGIPASASSAEMGSFFTWFVEEGWKRFNGKILPVSDRTP